MGFAYAKLTRLSENVRRTGITYDDDMLTRFELDELFHPLPRLETARLVLEPLRIVHADALFQVYSDPAVTRATSNTLHTSVEDTQTHIGGLLKRHDARAGISWALVLKDDERAVGQVTVHAISWGNRRGDLGFDLASRLWHRGLMSEALRATIQFCFNQLRFIKLSAPNTIDNDACHGLLLSLGFQQEGLLRQHGFWNDRPHDLRQYALLASPNAPRL